jgi:uncharacterized protein YeaO (DUF488 family)
MTSADINLRTKSVHSAIDPHADGLRILATRFRGRGLDPARYMIWMANLGPSEKLLRAVQEGRMTWAGFSSAYKKELFLDGEVDQGNETIKNHGQKFTLRLIKALARRQPVTLLCHCSEEQMQCHRHLLKEIILSNAV